MQIHIDAIGDRTNAKTIGTIHFVPQVLTQFNNFVLWRKDNDKKVLYSPNYVGKASSTNPKTWSSYNKALKVFEDNPDVYNGIGFVFSKNTHLVFIDADHCIKNGFLDGRAIDIFRHLRVTYAEVSQSGEGLHFIVVGSVPYCFNNRKEGIEMYNTGRYCAMTFNALTQAEPSENQVGIDYLFSKYKTKRPEEGKMLPQGLASYSDRAIVSKCRQSPVTGELFSRLYGGDYSMYQSHSEADIRLCNLLAFWCDRDPSAIDRIFRSSELYREKWERDDYRNNTIARACDSCQESVSEFAARKYREEVSKVEECFLSE